MAGRWLRLSQIALKELNQNNNTLELSLLLTDNQTIRRLNANWRNKDRATDVLSFPILENFTNYRNETLLVGDIVISGEKAKEQATYHGHSLRRELSFLFLHGLLHLLGHDHETEAEEAVMRAKQREILKASNK
ncbi:MAG: rRNA maturation RNase YbeY [Clostridiales bacterium]|nr:rRNA maturation RNase YbeY [Clostridiales bacterium]